MEVGLCAVGGMSRTVHWRWASVKAIGILERRKALVLTRLAVQPLQMTLQLQRKCNKAWCRIGRTPKHCWLLDPSSRASLGNWRVAVISQRVSTILQETISTGRQESSVGFEQYARELALNFLWLCNVAVLTLLIYIPGHVLALQSTRATTRKSNPRYLRV